MNESRPRATLVWALALLVIALGFRIQTIQRTVTFDYAPLSDDRLFEKGGHKLADSACFAPHSGERGTGSPALRNHDQRSALRGIAERKCQERTVCVQS